MGALNCGRGSLETAEVPGTEAAVADLGAKRELTLELPSQGDWQSQRLALSKGETGAWDQYLGDPRRGVQGMASPCALLKKQGTYYLYYIGADGLRSSDDGMRHRSLGVATSQDGLHFVKHRENPILQFQPHGNEEEGIYSAAAFLTPTGEVVLYYQAMNSGWRRSASVVADVRVAVSADGLSFRDLGEVLSHGDRRLWGFGDELFPLYGFHANETWHLYYLAKGKAAFWDLGLARGSTMGDLATTERVLDLPAEIRGGSGSPILDGESLLVPILRRHSAEKWDLQLRSGDSQVPNNLSVAEVTYAFPDLETAVLYLDRETRRWLLYYADSAATGIYVRTAALKPGKPESIDG